MPTCGPSATVRYAAATSSRPNVRSTTGTMPFASMARTASARSATDPVLLPTMRSALPMMENRLMDVVTPDRKPTVNTVPPIAAAFSERSNVASPTVSTTRSAPRPFVSASTAASQSGRAR